MKRKSLVKIFRSVYTGVIADQKDEVNFWVLLFFILTFTVSRLFVYYFPQLYIPIRHVHVHHFAYGILILAVIGVMALNDWHHKKRRVFGSIYGIGLGLSMDEFGMWIRLDDRYWLRHSYDAIFITVAILIFSVYFERFWRKLFRGIYNDDEENDNYS